MNHVQKVNFFWVFCILSRISDLTCLKFKEEEITHLVYFTVWNLVIVLVHLIFSSVMKMNITNSCKNIIFHIIVSFIYVNVLWAFDHIHFLVSEDHLCSGQIKTLQTSFSSFWTESEHVEKCVFKLSILFGIHLLHFQNVSKIVEEKMCQCPRWHL